MKLRIKTTYKRGADAKLNMLTLRILESLKDNPHFPNHTPARSELEKAQQEFQLAASVAGRFDRTLVSAKNDKKAILVNLLSELAAYIEATGLGDKTMLLSSGFDITGIKNEGATLPPIQTFTVETGEAGQATTRINRIPGARSYVHQYTPDPITSNSVWTSETVTERKHTFNNLPSVTKCWFRVIAVGRHQSVYSPAVAKVIQ